MCSKIKHILLTACCFTGAGLMTSCNDGFMDRFPETSITEKVFFSSPADLKVSSVRERVRVGCSPPFPFGLLGSFVPLSLPQLMKNVANRLTEKMNLFIFLYFYSNPPRVINIKRSVGIAGLFYKRYRQTPSYK